MGVNLEIMHRFIELKEKSKGSKLEGSSLVTQSREAKTMSKDGKISTEVKDFALSGFYLCVFAISLLRQFLSNPQSFSLLLIFHKSHFIGMTLLMCVQLMAG